MNKFEIWLGGFVSIAAGIVVVSTLGWYYPDWEMRWVMWCTVRRWDKEGACEIPTNS